MIKLTQLSELFENKLNALLAAEINTDEIEFKIWAEAGKYQTPHREDNTVTYYINGNIRTSTSANDANNLVMGVNGLTLEFAIPLQQPRTNAQQTAEDLQKIKDGQYPFVQRVVNAINSCFQTAQVEQIEDDEGKNFTVAYQSGTAISGEVDLTSRLGNYLSVSVYVEVYFIEGGLNSKDVVIWFDDTEHTVPFMAARHGRSSVAENEVYAGSLVSKSTVTSSAFALDIDFPLNSDAFTKACVDYLLNGQPNTAHFVTAAFGGMDTKTFLMTLNSVQTSAQGISIAGGSASLIETTENIQILNVPESYQVCRLGLVNNKQQQLHVTITALTDFYAFVCGEVRRFSPNEQVRLNCYAKDIVYDEKSKHYYVYIITNCAAVFKNGDNLNPFVFEIIKKVGE